MCIYILNNTSVSFTLCSIIYVGLAQACLSLIPRPSEGGEGKGRPNSYHVLTSATVHMSKEYGMTSRPLY